MKRLLTLFLTLAMLLSMGILPASAESADQTAKADEIYVFTEADNELLEADVFSRISAIRDSAASVNGGLAHMTELDYVNMIPDVIAAVKATETYVEGSLQRNGNFLVWETTVGIPCCYSPRMEAKLHNTENAPTPEQIAEAEAGARALLEEVADPQGGFPSSINIGLIQPYWESASNYADSSFNSYSPTYKALWESLYTTTGGQGIRYAMSNANINNIAYTMEQCGLVAFDSHGTTDYEGSWGSDDYTSQANSSYLCLTTSTGITTQDTAPQQGEFGTFYHCIKGSGYAYVDGTCIANHMTQNAPHSFLYMGICLGMATDGMEAGLRAKGVEAVWGYSQSVSFAGDIKYVKDLLTNIKNGDNIATAAAKIKAQYGNWDPAYSGYSYSQAVANHVAFPIVASSEDPYPGHGNVDVVQKVKSTWTLFTQYEITAVSNNSEWGRLTISGNVISATPMNGYYVDGYEILSGTANVTRSGNDFTVDAQSDCTVQINFAPRDPAIVHFSVPTGVTCDEISAYVGDEVALPTPVGEPVAEGREFNFLGWLAAPMETDSLLMPEFFEAGQNVKLTGTDTTYYALYSYFVAMDGLNDDQFVRVDKDREYWVGEYVITYNGDYALSANQAYSGNKIASANAVVDLEAAGCFCEDNILNNVTPGITYVISEAGEGVYTIKMKGANCYLAMNADSDSMTTFSSSNTDKTRWIITMGSKGPMLTNRQYHRSLQFDDNAKLFKCFSGTKQALTMYIKADGDTWYTTNPKDKVICDEHSFSDWITEAEPTCTETGSRSRYCTVCAYKETQELEALGHEFGEWEETLAPSCTEDGEKTRVCSRCDASEHEAVEALGHAWGEWQADPNTDPHSACIRVDEYRECERCGEREFRSIPGEGHKPGDAVRENEVQPTCTEAGGYDLVVYCESCGLELSREHADLEALGHEWDEGAVTLEPTYDAEGERTYTCTRCGETKTEPIARLEHDCPCAAFTDMPELGTVEHDAIDWAFTHDPQITKGTSDTTFGPEKTVTRGQAVTFLWRAAGCPEPTSTEHTFTDVKESGYYYKAMLWAVEKGITTGTSATKFSPNKTCTIEQILTFIYRYMEEPEVQNTENPWTDVNGEGFSFKAIMWAVENGIVAPKSETVFGRKDDCTRASIVTFLYRIMTGEGLVK